MPLPSGVTYVTVMSVTEFDSLTNKPTMCHCKFDVNGVEYEDDFNIGSGFLSSLNQSVVLIKRAPIVLVQAQNIVNNKISG
jgi:hypothetical protein